MSEWKRGPVEGAGEYWTVSAQAATDASVWWPSLMNLAAGQGSAKHWYKLREAAPGRPGQASPCTQCGAGVDPKRERYTYPICYKCLPPPPPMKVIHTVPLEKKKIDPVAGKGYLDEQD